MKGSKMDLSMSKRLAEGGMLLPSLKLTAILHFLCSQ